MSWPKWKSLDGPEYLVTAQTNGGAVQVRVDFDGQMYHGRHYGGGKCSTDQWIKTFATVTTVGPIRLSETFDLWKSDVGSHRSGVEGPCSKNESLWDGNAQRAWSELEGKTLGASEHFRGAVEQYLKGKIQGAQSFTWELQ